MRTFATTAMAISTTQISEANTLPPSASAGQRSPWHSPVPYLFGGLAAMLGLIAFALLILACSYWKLTGQMEADRSSEGENRDIERGGSAEKDDAGRSADKALNVYEEKILVIMAGDENPTFLATPVCVKASSFGDGNGNEVENRDGEKGDLKENSDEKVKKEEAVINDVHDHNHHHRDHHDDQGDSEEAQERNH